MRQVAVFVWVVAGALLVCARPFVSLAVAPDPRTSGPCEDPEDVHGGWI